MKDGDAAERHREPNPRLRFALFAFVALGLLLLYEIRPDGAQALHWWPLALWTPVVLTPFLSLRFRPLVRSLLLALAVWLFVLHVVGEPSVGALRAVSNRRVGDLRIVSLNCAGGSVEAAREAFAQTADVVLLQEVGSREEFVQAGREAGYPYASWSVDDAVFSTRPLADPRRGGDFAAATVDVAGQRVRLVSLRLLPPVFRLDLWNPDCWREYAGDLARRRARIAVLLADARAEKDCLIGGDFNATNPRIVRDARSDWSEAGRTAGRGWRGTGTNDFPVVWTDQVWGSPAIGWRQAFVRRTRNSDHRMAVADFTLARG